MGAWPVGISTGCCYRQHLAQALGPLRDAGFETIEVACHPEHFDYRNGGQVRGAARAVREAGLRVFSLHAPFGRGIDLSSPDRRQARTALDETMASADAAGVFGAGVLVVHPWGQPEDEDMGDDAVAARMERAARQLAQVARRCRAAGVRLLVENVFPGHPLGRAGVLTGLMERLLRQVDAGGGAPERGPAEGGAGPDATGGAGRGPDAGPAPGFCLDTSHASLAGALAEAVRALGPRLGMVHAGDNLGERDDHLPPGEGAIGWAGFAAALRRAGFEGLLMLELSAGEARNGAEGLRGLLRRAAAARDMLEAL